MLTQNKLRKGEGTLNPFDHEAGHSNQRRNMAIEESCWEHEQSFYKVFYNMT